MTTPFQEFVFCDSEVASIAIEGGTLRVRFAAAHVTAPDVCSFAGRVRGYVEGVELRAGGSCPLLAPDAWVGRLADGRVRVAGTWRASLPLPVVLDGPLSIELRFANRSELHFTATSLSLAAPSGAVFGESLAC